VTRSGSLAVLLFSGALVAACGSRGPLDLSPVPVDAGVDADAGEPADAATDAVEAGPRDAGMLVNCGRCLVQECGQKITMCLQSTACRGTMQCVVQQCVAMGGSQGLDPKCVQQCSADMQGLAEALVVLQCVTARCGDTCLPLLAGLGGNAGEPPQ
jgi:predicted small lipoprotein YifL